MLEFEAEVENNERVEILKKMESNYFSVQYELDGKIKREARTVYYREKEGYFQFDNSEEKNKELLDHELVVIEKLGSEYPVYQKRISEQEYEQFLVMYQKRAKLYDQFRKEGPRFSPEKMQELVLLERSPFAERSEKVGILELGRINKEFGIIKEGSAEVFPEYTWLSKHFPEITEVAKQRRNVAEWVSVGVHGKTINSENYLCLPEKKTHNSTEITRT